MGHVYALTKTSTSHNSRVEFAMATQNGLFFGSLQDSKLQLATEIYLQGQAVRCAKEIEPNRFIVGTEIHPAYFVISRSFSGQKVLEVTPPESHQTKGILYK